MNPRTGRNYLPGPGGDLLKRQQMVLGEEQARIVLVRVAAMG
ncbi:hypothetical protein SANTM175S_05035 [Streptomyces antimycoticus]